MPEVTIEPSFGDEHMDGEYDDNRFLVADAAFSHAVGEYVRAGATSEHLADAVKNALDEIGIA